MSEDYTIIIPTYNNRHQYLNRILDYYRLSSFRIIIVDSSKTKFEYKGVRENVDYYHVPNEMLQLKIFNALKKVKTKYALLWGDDDFIIIDAIEICVNFLNNNPTYCSAAGNELWFFNELRTNFYPLKLTTYKLDINNESGTERINQLYKNYTYLHYSVHRTKSLIKVYEILNELPDSLIKFNQSFLDIICLINGKHKVLPIFYGCKEISMNSATYTSKLETNNDIDDFLILIVTYLVEKENIDFLEAKRIIWNIFYPNDVIDTSKIKNSGFKKIINRIPYISLLKKTYSKLYYKYNAITKDYIKIRIQNARLIMEAKKLEGYPFHTTEGIEELKKIKKIVNKHWFQILRLKLGF